LVIFDGKENGQPMSLQHQFDLFRIARVVIDPHGRGLANILWLLGATTCEERPKVLEFLVQPIQTDIQVGQVGGSLKTYMYLYGFPK
jgi:capsular polysaccharide biosynthesis protein